MMTELFIAILIALTVNVIVSIFKVPFKSRVMSSIRKTVIPIISMGLGYYFAYQINLRYPFEYYVIVGLSAGILSSIIYKFGYDKIEKGATDMAKKYSKAIVLKVMKDKLGVTDDDFSK